MCTVVYILEDGGRFYLQRSCIRQLKMKKGTQRTHDPSKFRNRHVCTCANTLLTFQDKKKTKQDFSTMQNGYNTTIYFRAQHKRTFCIAIRYFAFSIMIIIMHFTYRYDCHRAWTGCIYTKTWAPPWRRNKHSHYTKCCYALHVSRGITLWLIFPTGTRQLAALETRHWITILQSLQPDW